MADGINVVWSMPRRPYIEELAAACYLSAHVEATHRGSVDTNEIDPAVGYEAKPFIAVNE
jgi:hypothetical protein